MFNDSSSPSSNLHQGNHIKTTCCGYHDNEGATSSSSLHGVEGDESFNHHRNVLLSSDQQEASLDSEVFLQQNHSASSGNHNDDDDDSMIRRVLKLLNLTPERFPSERLALVELKHVFDMNEEPFVILNKYLLDDNIFLPNNNDDTNSSNQVENGLNSHRNGKHEKIISKQNSEYLQQIGRTLSYILSRVFKEKKCYHRRDLPTIWIEARKLFFDYCNEIDPSLDDSTVPVENTQACNNHSNHTKTSEFMDGSLPCHEALKLSSQSLLDYLRVVNLENCWKLYCEELWCRLYQFTDYAKFSEVPPLNTAQGVNQETKTQSAKSLEEIMQFIENDSSETNKSVEKMSKKEMKRLRNKMLKDAKKQNKASSSDNNAENSDDKSGILQQDWLTKKNGFFMPKQCLDNVRYFVWGYHHAFESDWYMKDILDLHFSQGSNPFSRYNNIVLLDLDNVGQSIFLLRERNFDYGKDCLMIGIAGPKYSTSLRVSEEVLRERESSLHFVKIRMLEENGCIGMNAFEKYLFDFYDRGYFKKYKDAADYLLGCLAGALHRVTDIRTRIFIVSKDDGLRHIQKSLIIRGRHSYLVTSQESLMYTLDNYLFSNSAQWDRLSREIEPTLTKFHSYSLDDLASTISEQTSSHINKNESIDIDELSESKVSDEEKLRVYSSTTGVSFDREVHEKILGDYILEYYEKQSAGTPIRLDSIRIKGRRFSYQGWQGIGKVLFLPHVDITMLTEIDVRGCRIEDDGAIQLFEAVKKCHCLTLIDVGACFLTDKCARAIASYLSSENCSLQTLDLRWNSIGAKGAKTIMDSLEFNTSLTAISFRLNPMQHVGAKYVIRKALEYAAGERFGITVDVRQTCKNDDLGFIFHDMYENAVIDNGKRGPFAAPVVLDLCGNEIYPNGSVHLANFLKKSSLNSAQLHFEITQLILDYNNLGDHGTEILAKGLMHSKSILVLTLGRNYINEKGGICLAEFLKTNHSLTYLDLQKNKIGELGGFAIANALRQNQVLTHLNLKSNYIGDWGVLAFANMFSPLNYIYQRQVSNIDDTLTSSQQQDYNSTLIQLDLTNNRMTNTSAKYLAESLKANSSLCRVNFSNNPDMLSDSIINLVKGFYSQPTSEYQDLNCGSWWLELADCSLKDKAMQCLERFLQKPLSHLFISGNVMGDVDYSHEVRSIIQQFYPYNDIFSDNNSIIFMNNMFHHLAESLICVDLRSSSIGDDDLPLLFNDQSILLDRLHSKRKASNIYYLNLAGNNITQKGGALLKRMLQYNTSITCLILNYNSLGDVGLRDMIEGIADGQNHTLTSLSIRKNDITDVGALLISEYMKKQKENAMIGSFDLESNLITDVGAEYLSAGISDPDYSAIYFLSVERNALTGTGNRILLQSASRKLTSDTNSGIFQTIHLSV
ncbi:hypothetical protein C9374_011497 [Naegleria lovaniensis]|uniref:Uncharacterized protein n=1 Tax=Naegleria lovaniensis TaxID=51637 RepID=A0AA88H4G5_NAELO|nr:uncharacterized protein C9374_011497 [Naegleria lovaniensis]KAG2392772.1 hypothetical protein C9374_011497 [Naegleria lovaniensis]